MRSGKLDKVIIIERATETIDAAGTPVTTWAPILPPMRAQIIEANTDEVMRNPGEISEALTVFRMRFIDGVTLADRVAYAGLLYDIKGAKEIGRRRGLEIRALAKGGA